MTAQPLAPISQLVSLKGKRAIVTGAARGIGFAIASRLAEAGAAVVMADVNREKGETAAAELRAAGYNAVFAPCDVTSEADVRALVETAVREFGGLDILVNNAGIFPFAPMAEMSTDDFMRVMDVNIKGAFVCAREASRRMVEQGSGGSIINIASVDALHPSNKGLAAYDASKGALWTFTKSLASELGPHRIRANAIAPGGVMTEGARSAMGHQEGGAPMDMRAWLKSFITRTALKRMGSPDEIGRVALFLASDLSEYMTGSLVVVDGGMLIS